MSDGNHLAGSFPATQRCSTDGMLSRHDTQQDAQDPNWFMRSGSKRPQSLCGPAGSPPPKSKAAKLSPAPTSGQDLSPSVSGRAASQGLGMDDDDIMNNDEPLTASKKALANVKDKLYWKNIVFN